MSERHGDLSIIADRAAGNQLGTATRDLIEEFNKNFDSYVLIQVTDLAGNVMLASNSDVEMVIGDEEWFRTAAAGQAVTDSPIARDGGIDWAMAEPILGADGVPEGVVVGYLQTTVLAELLNPELEDGHDRSSRSTRTISWSTTPRWAASPTTPPSWQRARCPRPSTTPPSPRGLNGRGRQRRRTRDIDGDDVIGGYDGVEELDWVVIAKEPQRRRWRR